MWWIRHHFQRESCRRVSNGNNPQRSQLGERKFLLSQESGNPNPSQGDPQGPNWEKLLSMCQEPQFPCLSKEANMSSEGSILKGREDTRHSAEHAVKLYWWLEDRSVTRARNPSGLYLNLGSTWVQATCYRVNCVSPKFIWWTNPQYLRMWLYLKIWPFKRICR